VMCNHKLLHKYFNSFIYKMIALIAYRMGGVAKLSNSLFVNKFNDAFSSAFSKCLCLYPFSGIINGHYDISISFISCCQFD
jgi:hypothetical protein